MKTARFPLTLAALTILFASPLLAQEAARLAPPDAAVFLQVDDFAAWRAQWQDDPLVTFVRERSPMKRSPEGWLMLQAAMGMTSEQLLDTYFGKSVALVVQEPGENKPGVVLSRITAADFDTVKLRLELREIGAVGQFMTYATADGQARLGFHDGWMAFSGADHNDYFVHVLENAHQGPSLLDDEEFQSWTRRLPPSPRRTALGFARNPQTNEVHAITLNRDGLNLAMDYVGKPKREDRLRQMLSNASALDFGPLPMGTILAVTLNLHDRQPQPNPFLDRLLAPKTFNVDVLPRLAAPIVFFVGEVRGADLNPNPGLSVPAPGVAIRLKEPAVAADLDKIFDGLVLFANLASVQWKTDPIALTYATHRDTTYRVAGVGAVLAQRTQRPELAALKLTYGRVGDWYVVTAQDEFFKRCLDAAAAGQPLTEAPWMAALALDQQELPGSPVGTMVLRPSELAAHVQTWLDHWTKVRPEVLEAAKNDPATPEGRFVKAARDVVAMMPHFQAITLRAASGPDEAMTAHMEIRRAQP